MAADDRSNGENVAADRTHVGNPSGVSRISGSLAEHTARVLEVLNRAWLRVTAARLQVADLQSGAAAASRALSRAEMQTRGAMLETDPSRTATAVRLQAAAHEMGSVARRCHSSAVVGITLAGEVKKAFLLVEEVHATIRGIELDGLGAQEVSDLAVLGVRVEALGDLLGLALPMATAASENLYDAAHVARQVGPQAPDEPALMLQVDAATTGVSVLGRALGGAEQDGRHLGRTAEQAESIGHRAVGHADLINQTATATHRVLPGPGLVTYPQVLDLTVSEALRLGVEGTGPDANRVRLERAVSIIDQQEVASDQAYLATTWPKEPFVPVPAMAHILVRNDGDMSRAVQDPQIVEQVIEQLGSRTRRPDIHGVEDDLTRSKPEPFGPSVDGLGGWPVVREAVDALRRGVGVGPITDAELELAASSGARATDPGSVTSPQGQTESFDTAARDRLNAQSRDTPSRAATGQPPAPGR